MHIYMYVYACAYIWIHIMCIIYIIYTLKCPSLPGNKTNAAAAFIFLPMAYRKVTLVMFVFERCSVWQRTDSDDLLFFSDLGRMRC